MRKEAMNCKDTGELLTAYLDGEVTQEEKALVESHLPDCPPCQAELEALKATQAGIRGVLTSMADEVAPSPEAWQKVRAKIEKKDGWFESLGNFLANQKWQGVAITAAVVVVAVSAAIWQISGAGQSPTLVAPPPAGNVDMPTTSKPSATPTTPTTTPPPAQVTVNVPSVTVPAPAPAPAPVPTPATPPPPVTPPPTATTPPNITVGAPPPTVTVQAPPPASYPGPIVVVSVSGPLEPINPGGPGIEITLKNISSEPVANLTAILELNKPFQFVFSVLLAPGESTSTRLLLSGGEFSNNKNYSLAITGYYQSVARINYISYTIPVQITPPAVTVQSPPPAQVTVNVPGTNALYPAYLLYWLLLPIGLGIVLLLVCIWPKQKRK